MNSQKVPILFLGRPCESDIGEPVHKWLYFGMPRIHPQLRLFVLPAGLRPPNPQELLSRPVFEVVLTSFAEQYDLVILDTPASTVAADAQILAARAGAALVVARRNHTLHAELSAAMQNFVQSGVSVLGSVMNEY